MINNTRSRHIKILKTIAMNFCAVLFILLLLGVGGYADTHYSTTAEVFSVDNNEVILIDGAGYLWAVVDRPDLHKGDFVKVYFDNNTTDYTRNDDIILKVKVLDN